MTSPDEIPELPANLVLLRRLVTLLMGVMIVGFLVLIALFVIRLSGPSPTLSLPAEITLPDGTTATAFTQGTNWYAIVTDNNQILIYNRADNSLRQTIELN